MESLRVKNQLEIYTQRDGDCMMCPVKSLFDNLELVEREGRNVITYESVIGLCKAAKLVFNTEPYLLAGHLRLPQWGLDELSSFISVFDCNQDIKEGFVGDRCGSILIRRLVEPQNYYISRAMKTVSAIWFQNQNRQAS